eukprot:TRINITY_DN21643_c0_g1_i1.p1 TRINITY_DN21643_c0_g1~~TRINITY_DN21643_c0_g1_i1.p1  ORF type:complete len:678 (+),score=198.75 TRINITY_DN21643_c0_g1_i1:69-2036(+)
MGDEQLLAQICGGSDSESEPPAAAPPAAAPPPPPAAAAPVPVRSSAGGGGDGLLAQLGEDGSGGQPPPRAAAAPAPSGAAPAARPEPARVPAGAVGADAALLAQMEDDSEAEPAAASEGPPSPAAPEWRLTLNLWRTTGAPAPGPALRLARRTAADLHPPRKRLFRHGVFFKSAKWSPDGSVLLSSSEDNVLRLFDLPSELRGAAAEEQLLREEDVDRSECVSDVWFAPDAHPAAALEPVLSFGEGESVYDYAWYPQMREVSNCCFVTSTRDHPMHLWDAASGKLRATYRAYNSSDEIVAAHSVCWSADGSRLLGGYKNAVRCFDSAREGRQCTVLPTVRKGKKKKGKGQGASGIISCLSFCPGRSDLFACGSFSAHFALYDLRDPGRVAAIAREAHCGGLTHLAFSPSGSLLLTAARKDGRILAWDLRALGKGAHWAAPQLPAHPWPAMQRDSNTNQRISFDVDPSGAHVYSGCRSGCLRVYSLSDGSEVTRVPLTGGGPTAPGEALNGVQRHPTLPLLACTTGERRFKVPASCGDRSRVAPKRRRVSRPALSSEGSSDLSTDSEGGRRAPQQPPPPVPAPPARGGSDSEDLPSEASWAAPTLPPPPLGPEDAMSAASGSIFAREDELWADWGAHPPCPSHLEIWAGRFLYYKR